MQPSVADVANSRSRRRIVSKLNTGLFYGVTHNIAKLEEHRLDTVEISKVRGHREGATRVFPPGHSEIPERYHEIGQAALISGDMGRALTGQRGNMQQTFGTTCHRAWMFDEP